MRKESAATMALFFCERRNSWSAFRRSQLPSDLSINASPLRMAWMVALHTLTWRTWRALGYPEALKTCCKSQDAEDPFNGGIKVLLVRFSKQNSLGLLGTTWELVKKQNVLSASLLRCLQPSAFAICTFSPGVSVGLTMLHSASHKLKVIGKNYASIVNSAAQLHLAQFDLWATKLSGRLWLRWLCSLQFKPFSSRPSWSWMRHWESWWDILNAILHSSDMFWSSSNIPSRSKQYAIRLRVVA